MDHGVDTAVRGLRLVEQGGDLGLVGDVRAGGVRGAARCLDGAHGLVGGVLVARVPDDDREPVGGELPGDLPSDAARSAGHDRDTLFRPGLSGHDCILC